MAGSPSTQIDRALAERLAWAVIAADAAVLYSAHGLGLEERERRTVEALVAWRRAEVADGHGPDWGGDQGRRLARNAHRPRKRAGRAAAKRGRPSDPMTELDGALLRIAGLTTAEVAQLKEFLEIERIGKGLLLSAQDRAGKRAKRYEMPEVAERAEADSARIDHFVDIE